MYIHIYIYIYISQLWPKQQQLFYVLDIYIILLVFSYPLEFPGTVICIGKNTNVLNKLGTIQK